MCIIPCSNSFAVYFDNHCLWKGLIRSDHKLPCLCTIVIVFVLTAQEKHFVDLHTLCYDFIVCACGVFLFCFFVLAFCLDASDAGNVIDLDNTIHIYNYMCTYNSYRHNFFICN